MNRLVQIPAMFLAVVSLLVLASYVTTSRYWVGGFPSGEFRVNVCDADGKPVPGANLHVYHGSTRELALKYPLDNHIATQDLVSNERGRITVIRCSEGVLFGGHAWELFWVIPIGGRAPQYDCEITADGFKALKFPVWLLFESPHFSYDDFPKTKVMIDGEEIVLQIYENTFTLER
jgi:hypothetical protein